MPKYLLEAFEELKKASGIKKTRPKRTVAPVEVAAIPKPVEKAEEEKFAAAMASD